MHPFVPLGIEFIRSGALASAGPNAFAIYVALRAHVWRSARTGPAHLRELVDAGKLVASVSRRELEELTGLTVNTVVRALARLRELEWIETLDRQGRGASLFVLGLVDPQGRELFFADRSNGDRVTRSTTPRDQDLIDGGSPFDPPGDQDLIARGSKFDPPNREEEKEGREGEKKITVRMPVRAADGSLVRASPQQPGLLWGPAADRATRPRPARPDDLVETDIGRRITRDELDALESYRAKRRDGRASSITAQEFIAAWRQNVFVIFRVEDAASWASTRADRERLARTVTTVINRTFGGNRVRFRAALSTIPKWWQKRKEKGERWPGPPFPHLEVDVLGGRGNVSRVLDAWLAGEMDEHLTQDDRDELDRDERSRLGR